jgi:hypothetical protein
MMDLNTIIIVYLVGVVFWFNVFLYIDDRAGNHTFELLGKSVIWFMFMPSIICLLCVHFVKSLIRGVVK